MTTYRVQEAGTRLRHEVRPVQQSKETTTHPAFTTTIDDYAHELFREIAADHDIDDFLGKSDKYDPNGNGWITLHAPSSAEDLLDCALKIFSSIVHHFVERPESGAARKVIKARDDGGRPVLVVQATGPSFSALEPPEATAEDVNSTSKLLFSNIATYVLVKLQTQIGSTTENVDEVEAYARQVLDAQPGRSHIRCLIFTEMYVRLIHFDRSGAQVSPSVGIHQHPSTLIRLVAGLSSTDECSLGLDDTIKWSTVEGRKGQGMLTSVDGRGTTKNFSIVEQIPIPSNCIRGKSTTCWRVLDPETQEEYVVKDSWQPEDDPSEHELLELVKGMSGVVQMVSFETRRMETKQFRCASTIGQYHNRIATRIVMKSYGKPIEHFTSVLQLLCAIRDAIAGHQQLVCLNILHRDVSHNNVLLGLEGALEGNRGVLIDLDLAFQATESVPEVKVNEDVGTRVFQSLSVLTYADEDERPPHDYLDDLESFFYLLSYIFLLYAPDGTRQQRGEAITLTVYRWVSKRTGTALTSKSSFLSCGRTSSVATRSIESTWGDACLDLFDRFRDWIVDRTDDKAAIWDSRPLDSGVDPFEELYSHRDSHYSEVLKMFDDAIEALRRSSTASSPAPDCIQRSEVIALQGSTPGRPLVAATDLGPGTYAQATIPVLAPSGSRVSKRKFLPDNDCLSSPESKLGRFDETPLLAKRFP